VVPSAAYVQPAPRWWERWLKPAFAVFLVGYFLYFNRDSLHVAFAPDDMMNIYEYWRHGPFRLLYSQFLLWHEFYRPMGGVFYLPLFSIFGFNPLPFHVVALALLLANAGLVYRLGRLLGCGRLAAWCAAIVVAYHAGLDNLYYSTAFIYDVLCSVFFLAALVVYVRPRSADRAPGKWELVAFFACYVCALNSKEMAITLPLVVLAYEWLYHRPAIGSRDDVRRWLRGPGRIAVIAGIIALPYLYGRVLGLGGIVHNSGYHLQISFDRVLQFHEDAIRDLFLLPQNIGWKTVISLWAAITYLAWRRDQPILRWCWIVIVLTPVPVEFLEGRRAAVLAIPLAGWALFAAVLVTQAAYALSDFLGGEPGFRIIGRQFRVTLILAYVLFLWSAQNQWAKDLRSRQQTGDLTTHIIDQFRQLNPRLRPHSASVFLNDPFEGWDMYFIAQLWFRDRTLEFRLQSKTPEPLNRFDYVFDYRDGKLVQLEHVKSE
jgi:hypothetical protein